MNKCVGEGGTGTVSQHDVYPLLLIGLTACGHLRSMAAAIARFSAYVRDLAAALPRKDQLEELRSFIDMLKTLLPVDLWVFSEAEALASLGQ